MATFERPPPTLLGHPLSALERELKRLIVRDELERDQKTIVEQDGLSSRDVKDRLLQLYALYETFRNEDNTCLSDTDTKYNMYKLYRQVFKTKKSSPPGDTSAHQALKLWKNKPRAATALPLQRTISRLPTRSQICTSGAYSAPATFPHNGTTRVPARPSTAATPLLLTSPRRTLGLHKPVYRPHSAPADFQYNKLYTANRCHTARSTCRPCRSNCLCVICSPFQASANPCWRDITCALTPDRAQIEALWQEMSPLIHTDHIVQHSILTKIKKKTRNKKVRETTKQPQDDIKSTGSKDEVKRPVDQAPPKKREPQQAWTAQQQTVKSPKSQRKPSHFPQAKRAHRQHHNRYQRNKRTDKRYRWDKDSSDSESDDTIDNNDLYIDIDKIPSENDTVYKGRILKERKRHKWSDYTAILTARALYLYDREYDKYPKEVLPLWGTKLSINADRTDLQYSFILKTPSTNKQKALFKMSALTEEEMRTWLTKLKDAMKLNIDITAEIARNTKAAEFGDTSGSTTEHSPWSHEGYRIDVNYITDNILVCSFPPTLSDVHEMRRFMEDKHKGHYKIINVCEERSYDTTMFSDTVVTYPTPPNGVGKLSELWNFCEFTEKWFKESESNVILIHCRSGTVRSGLFVAAYLIHSRVCWTAEQAIKTFKTKRQHGSISMPCHKRYLKYIETSVLAGEQPEDVKLTLSSISLSQAPSFNEDGSCKPYFVIYQMGQEIYEFESDISYKSEEPIVFPLSLQVSGDIRILFYSVSDILGTQEMCTVHFHTFYINSSSVRFSREMVDGAHLNSFKQFTDSFSVTLEVK